MPHRAILFVDVSGSVRLSETLGMQQAALEYGRLHARLEELAPDAGGRLVKTLGDGALLSFRTAEGALRVARTIVSEGRGPLPLRATVCAGEVVEQGRDVFGEPVNIAARLLDLAKAGQVLTTGATVEDLAPEAAGGTRRLGRRELKGVSSRVDVVEVLSGESEALTHVAAPATREAGAGRTLRLECADAVLICGEGARREAVTVGRDEDCTFVIDAAHVSRRHLTIHHRNGAFYLQDHSANGTLLEPPSGAPVRIRNEETLLIGSGRIVPGVTHANRGHPHLLFAVSEGAGR